MSNSFGSFNYNSKIIHFSKAQIVSIIDTVDICELDLTYHNSKVVKQYDSYLKFEYLHQLLQDYLGKCSDVFGAVHRLKLLIGLILGDLLTRRELSLLSDDQIFITLCDPDVLGMVIISYSDYIVGEDV